MTTLTAVALDPGGTTGWASYQALRMVNCNLENEWYDEHWNRGQLVGQDHADDLETLLGLYQTDEYYIICERFTPRPNNPGAKQEAAFRYITVAERFAKEREAHFILQMPASAKNFVKDANIRKLGLWYPGWKHAMDGTRHLLFWLTNGTYHRKDLLEKGWKF